MNLINSLVFSFFIFFSFVGTPQKVGAMEEDSSDSHPPISSSPSEGQLLPEEMEGEVSQEIARCQELIHYVDKDLINVDDNLDELIKQGKILGFSGVPLPSVLLDEESLRKYVTHRVKRKRENKKEAEEENKFNSENSIKRNKTQETTVTPEQEEPAVLSQEVLLEKNDTH